MLCLTLTWAVCTGVLAKGVNSMGKAMYFIAIFPYVAITMLVMYSYTLDGAAEGIIFYLLPDLSRLLDIEGRSLTDEYCCPNRFVRPSESVQ